MPRYLALFLLLLLPSASWAAPTAILTDVKGVVSVVRGGKPLPAKTGFQLQNGDQVKVGTGSATVFSLSAPPRPLKANVSFVVGSGAAAAAPSVWKGVYNGLSQGFATRGKRAPAATRDNRLEPVYPSQSKIIEARPVFSWRLPDGETNSTNFEDYLVVVKTASGVTVWSGDTTQIQLQYPTDAPALQGALTWQVTPRVRTIDGTLQAKIDFASRPVGFTIATEAEMKALNAELANIDALLKASPQARTLSRVALLRSRGFYAKALSELPAPNKGDETSLILRRDLLASAGQMAELAALDSQQSATTPRLSETIEKYLAFDPTTVPPESRKRYVASDGAFAIEIPQAWGVLTADIPNGVKFYQWQAEFNTWPRFMLTVGPKANFEGKDFAVEMLTYSKGQGLNMNWETPQPTTLAGQKAERILWDWVDPQSTVHGETIGLTIGDRVFALSWVAPDRDSNPYRAMGQLATTLQTGVKPPAKIVSLNWDDLMAESKKWQDARTELVDYTVQRMSMEPSSDYLTLDKARLATPAGTKERVLVTQNTALAASQRGWSALAQNQYDEAKRWFDCSKALNLDCYQQEKAFYQRTRTATTARFKELSAQTPPVDAVVTYSMVLHDLLLLQSDHANHVELLSSDYGDSATSTAMSEQQLQCNGAFLHSLALANTKPEDYDSYRLKLIDSISWAGYAAWQRADIKTARAIYQRVIALCRAYPPPQSNRMQYRNLQSLARIDEETGDTNTARTEFEAALKVLDDQNAYTDAEIANLEKGLALTDKSQSEKDSIVDRYRMGIASTYASLCIDLGSLAHGRGDLAAAEQFYNKALATMEPLPKNGNIYAWVRAKALADLAVLRLDSGQTNEGLELLNQAFTINRQIGDDINAASNLSNIASSRFNRGDFNGARHDATLARDLLAGTLKVSALLAANTLLADIETTAKRYPAAEKIVSDSLALARTQENLEYQAILLRRLAIIRLLALGFAEDKTKVFTPAQLGPVWNAIHAAEKVDAQSGASWSVINTLETKALAQHAGGELKGAITTLKAVISRLETVRSTAASQEAFSESRSNYIAYDRIVRLLIRQNRVDEAFDYLSRARSKKLHDSLRLSSLKSPNPAMQKLLERAATLDSKLKALRSQLETAKAEPEETRNDVKIANLRDLVASTQAEFFSVSDQIKQQSPNFDKVLAVKPRELKKAQRALPAGALLLQYAPLGDKLYIFMVTRDDLKIYAPPVKPDDLKRRVREFRSLMDAAQNAVQAGKPVAAPEKDAKFKEVSTTLYGMLLAPVQAEIDKAKVVAIIPTQELFYLPFHALAQSTPTGLKFLIEQKPVAYLAAADVLSVVQSREDVQWGKGLLAMGDPKGANLPGALGEVNAIARIFPASDAVTGENATKATLSQPRNLDRKILHFATHGVLDSQQPDQSYIQLAPNGGDDGKLRIGEIYGLDLNKVDLVTLSACRTALGQGDPDGAEITSLADSFSSAGTPTVVASLWSVEDQSTKQLMSVFYKQLADGQPKGEALRAAQLELLKNPATRHPFYWAPFEMLGDWR